MKTTLLLAAWLIFLLLASRQASPQTVPDTTALYRIETLNGNEYIGNILGQDSARISFKSHQLGDISIRRSEIKQMEQINIQRIIGGKFWFENPQSSRYFWAPNAYGLKAGEGYYQNVWVLYNQVSVGLSDNFSIGAGMIPLFLFAGTSTPVWVIPKISIPVIKNQLNIGAGAIAGAVLGEDDAGFGIVYGVTTIGNRDNNISLGLGYGYASGDWAKTPLINLSAMLRTGSRGYFVTENYFISIGDNVTTLISFGGRAIIRRAAGLDYGLLIPISKDIDSMIAIPWLGITIPFGKSVGQENKTTGVR